VCHAKAAALLCCTTAVVGLLAGLALRYDASRIVNMQARATAAAAAISEALAALQPDATAKEMGDAAASAASTAYDKVCGQTVAELRVHGF
jgi:minor histocompatibility antigen H13